MARTSPFVTHRSFRGTEGRSSARADPPNHNAAGQTATAAICARRGRRYTHPNRARGPPALQDRLKPALRTRSPAGGPPTLQDRLKPALQTVWSAVFRPFHANRPPFDRLKPALQTVCSAVFRPFHENRPRFDGRKPALRTRSPICLRLLLPPRNAGGRRTHASTRTVEEYHACKDKARPVCGERSRASGEFQNRSRMRFARGRGIREAA
jgi:hypothetical protein